jgi:hypothetical protein
MRILIAALGCSAALGIGVAQAQTPAQTPAAPPQAAQPANPPVRMPENLPPPVGEELRVVPDDIDKLLADGKVVMLDVREPWELEKFGTREGYINIPLFELEQRLNELPKDKAILSG